MSLPFAPRMRLSVGTYATLFVPVLALAAWHRFFRYWFASGDDYQFTAVRPGPGLTFDASDWFRLLVSDWLSRNGRLSDSWLRLVLRPGYDTFAWSGPLILVVLGLTIGMALHAAAPRTSRVWPALIAGQLAIPTCLALWSDLTGDIVYWAAGMVNYLLPMIGVVFGITAMAEGQLRAPRHSAQISLAKFSVPVIVWAQTAHEQASLALMTAALVTLTLCRGRLPLAARYPVIASAVGFVLQMGAPGLWHRLTMATTTSKVTLSQRIQRIGAGTDTFVAESIESWALLGIVLGVTALLATNRRSCRVRLAVGGAGILLLLVGHWALGGGTHAPLGTAVAISLVFLLLVALAIPLAFQALLAGTDRWGHVPSLAAAAACIAAGPALLVGANGRAFFVSYFLLLMAVTTAWWGLACSLPPRVRQAGVIAVLVAQTSATALWDRDVQPKMRANYRIVHNRVEPQFHAAARGELASVSLPMFLPYPEYSYRYPYRVPRYDQALRNYYGLEDSVKIVNVPWREVPK